MSSYQTINKEIDDLRQRHAVMAAREEQKAERRQILVEKLKKLGVDPEKPVEELKRLQGEEQQILANAEKAVQEYRSKLAGTKEPEPVDDGSVDIG